MLPLYFENPSSGAASGACLEDCDGYGEHLDVYLLWTGPLHYHGQLGVTCFYLIILEFYFPHDFRVLFISHALHILMRKEHLDSLPQELRDMMMRVITARCMHEGCPPIAAWTQSIDRNRKQ
jgi:hypothetical protein